MSTTQPPPASSNDPLTAALARWRATVEAELKGASFDKKFITRTPEGIALQPLYTRADLAGVASLEAAPGAAPFVRGTRPLGYKQGAWQFAQEITARSAGEFNAALLPDLMNGQNAVVLTPDLATRAGLDPDIAAATAIGTEGVSLADVEDFETALKQVDLAAVPVHLNAGADASALAALYLELARRRGAGWAGLSGSVTADPLGEWVRAGELPAQLETLYDSLAGWVVWANTYAPGLQSIGINAAVWGDAGATAVQELAFALAAGAEYIRAVAKRGASPTTAISRVNFRFAIGPQFFMELAKFRALRPLWARVAAGFGAEIPAAGRATVHAVTGRWDKTMLDPHVNMLRVTTEALSAVLGGCDSLHISPFDEVTGATTDFSRRIARNVHTLLAEEFNFAEVADAAGGSWYVEKLTDQLARNAWALFQDIEARGGLAKALADGYPQQLVAKAAAEKEDGIAKRRTGVIGTNLFPNLKEKPLAPVETNHVALQTQRAGEIKARRGELPARRVNGEWSARFAAAQAAAKAGATVGQLGGLVHPGTAPTAQITAVTPRRAAAKFEALRTASAEFAARTGARPKVFLAKMGPVLQHKARADFSAGFFAVGGFEAVAKQAFETPEAAAEAAAKSGAPIAVLCSTDDTYPALVPAFAAKLKALKPEVVIILAGLPAEPATVESFRQAGINEFIHIRANVHDMLAKFLKQIGALS